MGRRQKEIPLTTTKMLISAQRAQQLRVAIVEGNTLKDYQVDITDHCLTRGNIYRGVVANVQPSLNAAFIDIGEERHGFLPVGDVSPMAYHHKVADSVKRPRIDQVLQRGKTVLVQVTKDGTGQKGAALTTNISIAGRYLVHTPFDSTRGISRKAEADSARKKIRDRLKKLTVPEGHGVIVRTNGLSQNQTTLNRDLNALVRLWKKVKAEISRGTGPRLLYTDQDLVVQALRDYLDNTIEEVLVDHEKVFEQAESYMKAFMPRSKTRLTLYQERLPLFSRYRLETQIDRITDRTVPLPGGGYLVIDPTEALTAIDVNSGRATKTVNHDESIFQVNLEAAQEIARHLRLRDIGGLVVVDFIDMRLSKHKNKLERALRDAMKEDKARYSVHHLSPNGLLEINRQRIKQALQLRTHRPCPSCQGVGNIASPDFAALSILGRLESRVATGLVDRITIALHSEVADVLQNQHRRRLGTIEEELDLEIEILSASNFDRTEERIEVHQRESVPTAAKPTSVLSSTDLATPSPPPVRGRQPIQSTEQASDEDGENGKPRKRRRRRRSPKRITRSTEAQGSEAQGSEAQLQPQDNLPSTAKEASEEQQSAREEGATETPRSRTRRPRRRRRPTTRAGAGAETSPSAEATSESAPPAEVAAPDSPEKSKPTRRRRVSSRPRRRVATSHSAPGTMSDTMSPAATAPAATGPDATSPDIPGPDATSPDIAGPEIAGPKTQPAEDSDRKPARTRAPRSRPSRSRSPRSRAAQGETANAKATESKSSEVKAKEPENTKATATKSETARPKATRSRTASSKTARATAAPRGDETPAGDQEESKTRAPSRRRATSRRRKPAPSKEQATSSKPDQPEGKADSQPSEAARSTTRRRSVTPRRRTAKATTPKTKPANLEEQPPTTFQENTAPRRRDNAPSDKLRWQWWGGGDSTENAGAEGSNAAPSGNAKANKGEKEGRDNIPGGES
jgi:ribonuclease E